MSRLCVPGLLFILATATPFRLVRGDEPAAPAPAGVIPPDPFLLYDLGDEDDDPELSAEDRKAIDAFVKKASEFRQRQVEKLMATRTADIVKVAQLDAAAEAKLKSLAGDAIRDTQKKWEGKFRDWMLPIITRNGNSPVDALRSWRPEQIVANNNFGGATAPDRTETWTTGLKNTLTPEQFAAFDAWEQPRLAKLREQLKDYLDASEGQAGEVMDRAMEPVVSRILKFGEIDEERQKAIRAAASQAVKATLADWRSRVEKQLMDMEEPQRAQMMKRGGSMGVNNADKDNDPQEQKVWKDAVAGILTDAERKKIEERRGELRTSRAEALGRVLLADLDRLVGFNESQRTTILAWLNEPFRQLPDSYFETPENGYYSLDVA